MSADITQSGHLPSKPKDARGAPGNINGQRWQGPLTAQDLALWAGIEDPTQVETELSQLFLYGFVDKIGERFWIWPHSPVPAHQACRWDIIRLLRRALAPLTSNAIVEHLRQGGRGWGEATVRRYLDGMVQADILTRQQPRDGPCCYGLPEWEWVPAHCGGPS